MMGETPLHEIADRIAVPGMQPKRPFHPASTSSRPSVDGIGLQATGRSLRIAFRAIPSHAQRVGKAPRGKSQFNDGHDWKNSQEPHSADQGKIDTARKNHGDWHGATIGNQGFKLRYIRNIWRHHWVIVAGMVLVGTGLRLFHLTAPLTDKHSFRQADVAMIASNFFHNGFDIRYPQINWAGALPGYVGTEFPLFAYLTAWLYWAFGEHLFLGRLVSISFAILAAILFYLLVRRYFSQQTALISLFFFIFSPANLYYTRTLMPESAMLCFSIGAIYFFSRWIGGREFGWAHYILALLCTALALLVKIPAAIIGLPMAYLAYERYGFTLFRRWELWLFALLVLLPPMVWYAHAFQVARDNYPYHMFGDQVWLKDGWLEAFLDWQIHQRIVIQVTAFLLTPIGIVLALGGVLLTLLRKPRTYLFHWWALGLAVYFIYGIRGQFEHDYYQLPLVPVGAFFAGVFSDRLINEFNEKGSHSRRIYFYIAPAMSCIIVFSSLLLYETRFYSPSAHVLFRAGYAANKVLPKETLIISADWNDPTLIWASHRKGWHFPSHISWRKKDRAPVSELSWTTELVEELRQEGAQFFVAPVRPDLAELPGSLLKTLRRALVTQFNDSFLEDNPKFKAYLDRTYPLILDNSDVLIYDLR